MKNSKNPNFFTQVIVRNLSFINENKKWFEGFNASEEITLNYSIIAYFVWHLNNIIASYSRGDDKNELKKQFSDAVRVMEKVWDKRIVKMHIGKNQKEIDVYYLECTLYMRWILSLAVLLEVSDDEFNILINLVKRDNIKDALYDICIKTKVENWIISDEVRPLSPKNSITSIIKENDKPTCEKFLKKYLEKHWFKTFKNLGGWQTTNVSNLNVNSGFVGFWAFEVAAIVKIKGLNDNSFKDNVFYPHRFFNQN